MSNLSVTYPSGCAEPASAIVPVSYPVWTNPDTLDIQISSAADPTNGVATCNSVTAGPVTLTATVGSGTGALSKSVTLTCE